MASKSPLLWRSLIVPLILLASCTTAPVEPTATVTPPMTEAPGILPTFIELPPNTPTLFPSPIVEPTTTPFAQLPVSTATEIYPLDNLRMAYIVDGNLYVQNGSNPPKQLTNSREDIYPIFSDDGEKIIFYRGKIHDNNRVFSVNADGSQMQEIITTVWLDTLGVGTKAGHLAFIPNTHQFLFNTYLCSEGSQNIDKKCTVGLFLADTDTGEIKMIMQPKMGSHLPWSGNSRWGGNFSISPDGKLVSVAYAGQIDILDMDGKTVHSNIINYIRSVPIEFYPRVYWLSNSNDLIIALPIEAQYYMGTPPQYIVWRYALDKKTATQISLDPLPIWAHMESNDVLSISPNKERVLYFANGCQLYKSNLLDGKSELLLPCDAYILPMQWSSDNIHFSSNEYPIGSVLGSVNGMSGYPSGYFLGWIDTKRFIYFPLSAYGSKNDIQILVGEIDRDVILSYASNVFIPNIAPYPESFACTSLENK